MTFGADKMSVSENAMDEFDRQRSNRTLLESAGAYSESMEHDACGVGLVAAIDGQAKRSVVEAGLAALKAIWHRGAMVQAFTSRFPCSSLRTTTREPGMNREAGTFPLG